MGNPDKVELNPAKERNLVQRLILFDMDKTLVDIVGHQESGNKMGVGMWQVLFDKMGMLDEHARLKERFKAGEFSHYMLWTDEACKVLKKHGLTEKIFSEIVDQQPLIIGARETISELKKMGFRTAIATGSFGKMARKVQDELGIDDVFAHCDYKFDREGNLEDWNLLACDYGDKAVVLSRFCEKYETASSECIVVGDGINDISAMQAVRLSIAFHPDRQEVRDVASFVVEGKKKDLRSILPYIIASITKNP